MAKFRRDGAPTMTIAELTERLVRNDIVHACIHDAVDDDAAWIIFLAALAANTSLQSLIMTWTGDERTAHLSTVLANHYPNVEGYLGGHFSDGSASALMLKNGEPYVT